MSVGKISKSVPRIDLSIATELEISKAVVGLQDHKINPECYRIKSFIIRKGFGAFNKMIKEANYVK